MVKRKLDTAFETKEPKCHPVGESPRSKSPKPCLVDITNATSTETLVANKTNNKTVDLIDVDQLALILENGLKEKVLIIDSRSFLEFNTSHISYAININCSKLVKRRLQQDKISIKELLVHSCHCEDIDETFEVIVYDQGSIAYDSLTDDSFVVILMEKLNNSFNKVSFVTGGFLAFQQKYPRICDAKTNRKMSSSHNVPLTSLSQPCLPISNQGPSRILPFLYLGSQEDALNQDMMRDHNITYVLNVSISCPKPDFIQDSHFMRISVNDNHNEKLIPYFKQAFDFLDNVRQTGGCVIVHCMAGISRSTTIVISYIMQHLRMTSEEAYRYVKSKRTRIAPNFNFLGQLLEHEKQLYREGVLGVPVNECSSAPATSFLASPTHHSFAAGFHKLTPSLVKCIADNKNVTNNMHASVDLLTVPEILPTQDTPSPSTEMAKLTLAPIPFCRRHELRKTLADISRKYDNVVEG